MGRPTRAVVLASLGAGISSGARVRARRGAGAGTSDALCHCRLEAVTAEYGQHVGAAGEPESALVRDARPREAIPQAAGTRCDRPVRPDPVAGAPDPPTVGAHVPSGTAREPPGSPARATGNVCLTRDAGASCRDRAAALRVGAPGGLGAGCDER